MPISKRLTCLADLVEPNSIIADIGCDHGLLPIYLCEKGICTKAYACDLREGPLSRARKAIEVAGFSGTISTLLTDGLHELPEEVDTIIIAGMGFETIQKILEDNLEKVLSFKHIILQSNTDIPSLRKWLSKHHFLIIIDKVIKDGHFYHIMKCEANCERCLTEDEITFGVFQDSPDFLDYCKFELNKTEKILSQLSVSNENYNEIANYKEQILKKIKHYT